MQNQSGGGSQTGTRDTTYDLTAVLYHALQGVENCRTYEQDAQSGDQQMQQFFQQAAQQQQQLADRAKQLLHDCLMKETQGGQGDMGSSQSAQDEGAAFNFNQQGETGSTGMGAQSHEMSGGQSGGTGGSSGY